MKLSARYFAWLLPLLLTGCFHWHRQAKNVPVAPPLPSAQSRIQTTPVELSAEAASIPPEPTSPAPAEIAQAPAPRPRRRRGYRRRHPETAKNPEMASSGMPAVSAIGQLSSGDPVDVRTETANSIAAIEKSLNEIHRSLDASQKKTADHIREFLKQAQQALASGDIDGAHTLAAKAKVLLNELTK